jgi:hypothetical protein
VGVFATLRRQILGGRTTHLLDRQALNPRLTFSKAIALATLALMTALWPASTLRGQTDSPPNAWQRFTTRARSVFARPAAQTAEAGDEPITRAAFDQPQRQPGAVRPASAQQPLKSDAARKTAKPRRTVSEYLAQERP